MADIICLGEALIDFVAVDSGKKLKNVGAFKKVAGGAPANVAAGAQKLGKESAFLGRIGDDEFGYFLRDTLKSVGVDCSQIQYDKEARTGLAFISLPTPNTREFLFYRNPSADMRLDSAEFDEAFIKNAKIFHFGSITLINEPSRSATLKALGTAKSSGAIISYDPNLRLNLWPNAETAKLEINAAIPLTDLIKVNDEELNFLTGIVDIEKAIDKILSMGPKLCIVTLGEKGCYYKSKNFFGKFNAFKVDSVDSTGCGDSFVSSVLVKIIDTGFKNIILEEDRIVPVIRFASGAAAITSTNKGVIASLPGLKEVEDFLLNN